jgi:acyl-CoA thioesterase-2
MNNRPAAHLLGYLEVTPADKPDIFTGNADLYGAMGVYGGHLLGQGLNAALCTVDEPKTTHSFHAYFLRRCDPADKLQYQVQRLRSGKWGDTRSVAAVQNNQQVFHMIASFKVPESGDEHQKTMPPTEPPETLIQRRQNRGDENFPFPPAKDGRTHIEFASRGFDEYIENRSPELRMWMRAPYSEDRAHPLTPRENQIALAYLSDATLLFNSVLPYGVPMQTHRMTSLDQSCWFHHTTDASQWMLFDQRSVAATDGRGLNEGEIFSADGKLVMSCSQECMLRRIEPT